MLFSTKRHDPTTAPDESHSVDEFAVIRRRRRPDDWATSSGAYQAGSGQTPYVSSTWVDCPSIVYVTSQLGRRISPSWATTGAECQGNVPAWTLRRRRGKAPSPEGISQLALRRLEPRHRQPATHSTCDCTETPHGPPGQTGPAGSVFPLRPKSRRDPCT